MTEAAADELDILTTSVGRLLIQQAYGSLLDRLDFDGRLHIKVTLDPSYGVSVAEQDETVRWLEALPATDSRISSVEIARFPRNVGLQRALTVLLAMGRSRHALHFEDDWRVTGTIAPRRLIGAMQALGAGMIALTSPTAAARGTFDRPGEHSRAEVGGIGYKRLRPPSWAADYLPLHPHLHDAAIWPRLYLEALALDDDPARCPDERVREHVRIHKLHDRCPVWWTEDLLAEDIGRAWAAGRAVGKQIGPDRLSAAAALPSTARQLPLARSQSYGARAEAAVPGGSQTFMKRACNFPADFPRFIDKGEGPWVWDVDGNAYVDLIGGLGVLALGHAPPLVSAAVSSQLGRGTYHSLPVLAEVEAAERLARATGRDCSIRFFKSGADACSAALRLARAVTGRTLVASTGYHGFHDQFMAGTPGVPAPLAADIVTIDPFETEGPAALETLIATRGAELATYILALPYDRVLPPERARAIETLVRSAGALFVMDEMVTGFRLGHAGASEMLGLTPDARCYGKALAAGMPLAALAVEARHAEVMAALHVSTTYGGETLSLAAAGAAIDHYAAIDLPARFAALGHALQDGINARAEALGLAPVLVGYPAIPWLTLAEGEVEHRRRARPFQAAAARRGVLVAERSNFVNAAQDAALIEDVVERLGDALEEAVRQW